MKATVTVEIEIVDNIETLYPNFIFNYENKQDFLEHQISSLNHNLALQDNDGYRQKVVEVKTGGNQ